MNDIKQEIRKIDNLSDLNSLRDFISECKIMLSKSTLDVGSCVWVVQKTKRTEGVITKMNIKKAIVDIKGMGSYNVPLGMLEAI
tara:strand:+ start:70 stop:321 length:252 start_codon:yes stop_codon:yes gene_type:complete